MGRIIEQGWIKMDSQGVFYYSCMDCEWEGKITECDFDTEYNEYKGATRRYPICPKCGGGLDC